MKNFIEVFSRSQIMYVMRKMFFMTKQHMLLKGHFLLAAEALIQLYPKAKVFAVV